MSVKLDKISTERRNQNTMDIDRLPTIEILKKLNAEDKTVPLSIEKALPQISLLVDALVEVFEQGGRLIYVGAGTSGRIGILDASECPPTYGTDPSMVQGLIAGGKIALEKAVEGAEDSKEDAVNDLQNINLTDKDFVVGIAASGRTPYVLGAVEYANSIGCLTGCITTSAGSVLADSVSYPIEAITGAEPVTGSTRMKSGTAQKLICNMITTSSMIRLGKVYQNLMVDVVATNLKLEARVISIIKEVTSYTDEEAHAALLKYKSTKGVILAYLLKEEDPTVIEKLLEEYGGNLRKILCKEEGSK